MGFHSQGVHVESPTYPASDVGISPRSKQSLHSCNIIIPCSLPEFVSTVLSETIELLRGHHSDATGCRRPSAEPVALGKTQNLPAMTGQDREKVQSVLAFDCGKFKRASYFCSSVTLDFVLHPVSRNLPQSLIFWRISIL